MDKYSIPRPKRKSYVKHRQDVTRQIIAPIIVVILLTIVIAILAGYAAVGNNPAVNMWANISIIWLIIPMMMLALVILVLTVAMVYGLNRLLKVSPHYTGLAQAYVWRLNTGLTVLIDKLVRPVLTIRTWLDLILKREK